MHEIQALLSEKTPFSYNFFGRLQENENENKSGGGDPLLFGKIKQTNSQNPFMK